MQQESPIAASARLAAEQLNKLHFDKVNDLLRKHELITDGEKLDEKSLEAKGYLINQVMLPGNQYRLQLARIEDVVEYKAEVKFDLEVYDMTETTFEDTPERREQRASEPANAPAPAEEEAEDDSNDE